MAILLVVCQDLQPWDAIDDRYQNERADERPREADDCFKYLYTQLPGIAIEEDSAFNLDAAVRRNSLLSEQPRPNSAKEATNAMRCKRVTIVHPSPALSEFGELDP